MDLHGPHMPQACLYRLCLSRDSCLRPCLLTLPLLFGPGALSHSQSTLCPVIVSSQADVGGGLPHYDPSMLAPQSCCKSGLRGRASSVVAVLELEARGWAMPDGRPAVVLTQPGGNAISGLGSPPSTERILHFPSPGSSQLVSEAMKSRRA